MCTPEASSSTPQTGIAPCTRAGGTALAHVDGKVWNGVIQRYEIALDVARQLTVRVLKDVFGIDEAPARKDTFREAARLGLVADAQAWIGHLNARNRTSHTYDSEMAKLVFRHIPTFPADARDLLRRLEAHVA